MRNQTKHASNQSFKKMNQDHLAIPKHHYTQKNSQQNATIPTTQNTYLNHPRDITTVDQLQH